jgi:Ca2+-transporting ATPase
MKTNQTNLQKGLTGREIPLKKRMFGDNIIEETKKLSTVSIFFRQLKDFITLVLIAATVVSALLGEIVDATAITLIIIMNAVLGFIQEYRTEKSLQALKQLSAPMAKVLRDGKVKIIPSRDVVPGDIAILESGDRVPADGELIECSGLSIDESILTGESIPVEKTDECDENVQTSIYSKNLVFMGTLVVSGRGKMLVTAIGMDTQMGKIAGMLVKVEDEQTPLQKRLDHLGRQLVFLCLAICAIVALLGIYRGEGIYDMFLLGVSLAVAAIPEGLPAIVTVVLAIGVQRMIRKNAVIRRLPAVETLGCATVICSDKTGTLTENRMTVRKIYINGETFMVTGTGYRQEGDFITADGSKISNLPSELTKIMQIGLSCNNAGIVREKAGFLSVISKKRDFNVIGDPTEAAILIAGLKVNIQKEIVDKKFQRIRELPFDSNRKRMSVIVKSDKGDIYLFTKGAPDVILSRCSQVEENGVIKQLFSANKKHILAVNEDFGREALRVLAFAHKKLSISDLEQSDIENGMTFLGMMAMIDPPRPEALEAVKKCFLSGIRSVMITGDHKATAWAVANELGLLKGNKRIITGDELDEMSDNELNKCVDEVAIYARVTPLHKLKIVRALKRRGHIVAMTGDGVNDAPAVKEADIGIAMGKTGTDVTKEASSMILMDDNFASIVNAVEEGRIIYDNIRKFVRYLLSCNVGEIFTMAITAALGMSPPLLPIQILWMNLVTDGLPAMALGMDSPERDVMMRKPRKKNESIFSDGLWGKILHRGLFISVATVITFIITGIYTSGNLTASRTAAFSTLVISQLIFVFECRTGRHKIWEQNPFSNIYLTLSVIVSAAMHLAVIYVPKLQFIFHTTPPDGQIWLLIIGLAGLSALF